MRRCPHGSPRPSKALKSLRKRGLIDYAGNQGAKGCIRFLWHPWIPETCALNAQVSLGTERREKQREEREALGTLVPSLSDGPLAGNLRSFFSSLSSQKEERQDPACFDEIRGVYPGTNVTGDLKRIEEWARKNKKPFTRELALNALRRHPPKKPGQREGYVYKGKFIESEKANVLAVQNPAFLLNAKRTIRHADGQTEMV